MTPEILLVPSGVTLVPGVTGRADVARAEREAAVEALARALARTARRASGTVQHPGGAVRVTVVAPAPVETSRTTDDGVPDLGAAGFLHGTDDGRTGPALHVAASVVTVLLRLAGWHGPIRTLEVGGSEVGGSEDGGSEVGTDGTSVGRPWSGSGLGPEDPAGGPVDLLVFTTLAARLPGSAPTDPDRSPDGAAPLGAPDRLRRADRRVSELHRAAVARVPAS